MDACIKTKLIWINDGQKYTLEETPDVIGNVVENFKKNGIKFWTTVEENQEPSISEIKEEYLAMKKGFEEKLKFAEQRVAATKKREIRNACDGLFVIQQGLKRNTVEKKTSLTEMNNYLAFVEEIIDTLKKANLFTDPME